VHKPVIQLLTRHPRRWEENGGISSTVWTFFELQMALTLGYIEVDELFYLVKQISVYRTLFVLCVLEM
jgi:hypothetical protein